MIPLRDRLPSRTTPWVNYGLIAANVLAFLWQLASADVGNTALAYDWGFVPERFLKDPVAQVMTVWTAMFLHGSWLHIAGNMLFLWVFGDNVEDALGHGRYLLFYLAGGFLAAMAQCLAEPSAAVPMMGASGAIAAVLAGYVTLYPKARILVLFPVFVVFLFFEFPAWLVMLEWIVLNVVQALVSVGDRAGAGVAWFAHVGGFLAGLFLIRLGMVGRERIAYEKWRGFYTREQPSRSLRVRYRRPPGSFR
ncbi:MAG TPA: rhomboid family intramembrane serine protease [Polyangiaceae bacterium]|nr:rhomboid family intramembrane serine protease [Polyangiaceae bacterium]